MDTSLAGRKLAGFYQGFLDRLDRPGWRKFASAMVALGFGFLHVSLDFLRRLVVWAKR